MEFPYCPICHGHSGFTGPVCNECRMRLSEDLTNLADVWDALSAEPGRRIPQRVSGSAEPNLGVRIGALDQMLPARIAAGVTDHFGDQIGAQPTAVILASWVADWVTYETVWWSEPDFTVPEMAAWLVRNLDWACDKHPAIDEFASEIADALTACRAACDLLPTRPELCDGIACQRCDHRALYRAVGRVTCAVCGRIYELDEYHAWVRQLAEQNRQLVL